MIRKIPFRTAVNLLLFILSALMVYHLLIVSGVIPFDIVWGGRLKTADEMYRMESLAIIFNVVMLLVVAIKGGYIKSIKPGKVITVLLWIMFASYVLNTLGNAMSVNKLEAAIFTPLTLIAAILCMRLAVE